MVKVLETNPSWGDSVLLLSALALHTAWVRVRVSTCTLLVTLRPGSVALWSDSLQADAKLTAVAGFKEQIYDVYRYLPPATQVVLISATLPHEILEMTNKFMTDPIRILVKR